MTSFQVANTIIDDSRAPYIIAEIGVNHDGALSRALELVDAAADAGADAVKFQMFDADLLLSKAARLAAYQDDAGAPDPMTLLSQLQLNNDDLKTALERAHSRNIHAIVTVFSPGLVDAASDMGWDAWKTASPDGINKPLIDQLTSHHLPMLLSTGTMTVDEITRLLTWVRDVPHALLHCVSAYPTPEDAASLGAIAAIAQQFNVVTGYSDHTSALDTGALAVAAGARILEKHLTWNRAAPGPDHQASIEPDEFQTYCAQAHRAFRMTGPSRKAPHTLEDDVRAVSRQSLVSERRIEVGEKLRAQDLTVKRPGTGIEPWRIDDIIGRTAARTIDADVPIQESDLA